MLDPSRIETGRGRVTVATRDEAHAESWFEAQGWKPFAFQREVWAAMAEGQSGLLHATTGSGKTYAVWFGALARAAALGVPLRGSTAPPLGVLWLTPMRALAADSARAIKAPLELFVASGRLPADAIIGPPRLTRAAHRAKETTH